MAAAMITSLQGAALEVDVVLLKATQTPEVAEVAPYPRALCTYLYEVKKVHGGEYDGKQILVVKWAVWEKAKVLGLPSEVGTVERLKLDRWVDYPEFSTQRIVDSIGETDLVIYYATDSKPKTLAAP